MGDDPDAEPVMQRIREAIQKAGGVPTVSERTGIPRKTLEKYLAKRSMPSFDNAARIAQAAGMSISELAGEPPRPSQSMSRAAPLPTAALRIVDELLRRVYREEKVKLPADALMPETLRHAQAMIDRMDDPADAAEAATLAPWLEGRIRKELQSAAAAPGTGKREAS